MPSAQPHGARRARAARPRRDDAARGHAAAHAPTTRRYERFKRLCHAHRPAGDRAARRSALGRAGRAVARRLRDILVGFGAQGRESVQQLMSAANWEVRRTAAFLLREFGGAEGLKELQPLLTDTEPLVQREAIQALVLNGTDEASQILLTRADHARRAARARRSSPSWSSMRDERAAPLFCYLVRHLDRRKAFRSVYLAAIEALGRSAARRGRGAEDALQQRRLVGAAAHAAHPRRRGRRRCAGSARRPPSTALREAVATRIRAACARPPRARARSGLGRVDAMSRRSRPARLRSYDELLRRFASGVRAAQLYAADTRWSARNIEGLLAVLDDAAPAAAVDRRSASSATSSSSPTRRCPRPAPAMAELIRRLQGHKIERIAFERGVTPDEVDRVRPRPSRPSAARASRPSRRRRSPHIRVGRHQQPRNGKKRTASAATSRPSASCTRTRSQRPKSVVGERGDRGHARRAGGAADGRRAGRRGHAEPHRARWR